MSANRCATGYDVEGTDQTSLGQLPGRDQHTFILSGPRDHRDLHSFPTRRSSDLRWTSTRRVVVAGVLLRPVLRTQHRPERSEEHTSELQSPYDLVCRLLLEKKKKKIITTMFASLINIKQSS